MSREWKPTYKVCAIYDTETCNVKVDDKWIAYPVLFIINDLRSVDLSEYVYERSDTVFYYRHEQEFVDYIRNLAAWGRRANVIPVVAAYNLMFDLQPVMETLAQIFDMQVNAQSSTNVYTLDLMQNGRCALRFWDTYHLDMRGLSAMGDVCGLPKATGSWDYDKVRTPETPLTKQELYYAKRDVQVIPAYLRYLLDANEWMQSDMFGFKIITKTSIVRQMARRKLYNLTYKKSNGKRMTVGKSYDAMCETQKPATFDRYALRKTCFRGGFTFTSAKYASKVLRNVASLDVTSMHHAFINGRYLPVDFRKAHPKVLQQICETLTSTTPAEVLSRYQKPFWHALHVRVRFANLRLRSGSAFDAWKIALIPQSKFRLYSGDDFDNPAKRFAETHVKLSGWHDVALNPVFAFGKLYAADEVTLHITELELWAISRVYEWDAMQVVLGEFTARFCRPPDYVTAQSHYLYELKTQMKDVCKRYDEKPLDCSCYTLLDEPVRKGLESGSYTRGFIESYYQSTVKGMFNSIYGVQAQDVYKPAYTVDAGIIRVDETSAVNEFNFAEKADENKGKVLYTYGMRIVGGSRMHLILAIELLYQKLGDSISVLAGDTDSLKIRCDASVTDDMLLEALEPLHEAITDAIKITSARLQATQPKIASQLRGVGCFEVEDCGNSKRYDFHMEAWNKARISIDTDGKPHVTCAGLSRPVGSYTIENFISDMLENNDPASVLPLVLGYNVYVPHDVCHALEHSRPAISDCVAMSVTDYLGNVSFVDAHQSIALYPSGRMLGDTVKKANACNMRFVTVDARVKTLQLPTAHDDAHIVTMSGDVIL